MATPKPKFSDLLESRCADMAVLNGRLSVGMQPEDSHAQIEIAVPGERASAEISYLSASGSRQERSVNDRQVSIIPAGQPHRVQWRHDADLTVVFLSPALVDEVARESGMKHVELVEEYAALDPVVWHLVRDLRAELRQHHRLATAHLESVAMVLARHILKTYAATPWPTRKHGGLPRYKLRRAVEYIRENIDNDISFRDVAAHLDMSAYHFAHMFKHSTGEPPHRYIVRCRVDRAKELLSATRLPIADVAFEVGYKSQSHFTTCFGKLVGITPAAFRAAA